MAAADDGYRERTYSSKNGLRLYFRDYGDALSSATPVLCLSGLTRNSKDFALVARRLSGRRRVLCPDYRGRGRSQADPDWRNYDPPVLLGDILQLLAATNLHRVAVCGVSFGGLLAMALAVAAPTTLAGVILDDIGPEIGATAQGQIFDYVATDRPQPDWPAAVAEMKARFPNLSHDSEAAWRRFAEATYREGDDGRLHFDWDVDLAKPLIARRGQRRDHWPLYRALGQRPALAVRGGLSEVLSAATLARMAVEKPDLMHLTLAGVGHAPSLEEPEAEQAIDELLARIDG